MTDVSTTCAVVIFRVKRCTALMMIIHVFVTTFTGLTSHPRSSQSPSSLTEPTSTLTETIKSSVIKSSPVSGLPSYSSKTRSISAHTSITPVLSAQGASSNLISASLDSLSLMSSAVTNRFQLASSKLSLKRSSMYSSTGTHTPQVKPTHSSVASLSLTAPAHQSSSASISSSVAASVDSPNKSVRQETRHKRKTPIPYWSIAASFIGCIFVIMVAYLLWKLNGQTQGGNDTQGPLPDHPQGEDNPVYDRMSMVV